MSRRCSRLGLRAWAALLVLAASLAAAGAAYASFSAQTTVLEAVSTRTLGAPSGLSASASGHDVLLSWSAGTNGSGYRVQATANGLSSDCSGASWSGGSSTAALIFTDSGRWAPQGSWVCYSVQTTYGGWTSISANPVVAAQVGFLADSISGANGGVAGQLDTGDRITVSFNQAVRSTSGPSGTNTVCITSGSSATLVLGSTTRSGACSASESTMLGKAGGLSVTSSARWSASYSWTNGGTTLTVTLGSRVYGSTNPTVSAWGLPSFTPTTTTSALLSSSGGYHVCDTNTAGSDCLPQVSGSV